MNDNDWTKTKVVEEAIQAYWGQGGKTIEAADNDPEAIAELVRRLRPAENVSSASGSHDKPHPTPEEQVAKALNHDEKKRKRVGVR